MKWTKRSFELGAERLHKECAKRKQERNGMYQKELRSLACQFSVADGLPIDSDADIEIVAKCGGRCRHIIITTSGDMYVDGLMKASIIIPENIHSVNQHYKLSIDVIRKLHKQFEYKILNRRN